jgi:hypothetical protein
MIERNLILKNFLKLCKELELEPNRMKENKKSEPESEPELCQNGIGCNTESHN